MITLGVNGGISARSCRPAAAPILEPQDRDVVLGRGPVPVICLPLFGPSAWGRAGLCRELISASSAQQPANHAGVSVPSDPHVLWHPGGSRISCW